MNELKTKALDYLEKFEALAVEYTPQVIDAGLAIAKIEGIQNLVYGLVWLLVFFVVNGAGFYLAKKTEYEHVMLFSLFSIVPLIPALVFLSDIWSWVAIFYPELYIGYKLIN